MNKLNLSLLLIIGISGAVKAQDTTKRSSKNDPTPKNEIFNAVEVEPAFSGDFGAFLGAHMIYPEVDKIVGITGKVFMQFVIEKDGSLTEIRAIKYRTTNMAAEATRVLSLSPHWRPGIQNGKPVRVLYTVPITFALDSVIKITAMQTLQKSDYGFAFSINGQIYSLDEAQQKLGGSFDIASVEDIQPNDDPKYAMAGKKAVYLITIRKN